MKLILCSVFLTTAIFAADDASTTPAPATSASGVDLGAMDTHINPCQNFYQYACGTWRKDHAIPSDQSRWGRFNELAERNLTIERQILEKAETPSPDRSAVEQKIGDYYESCMNEPAIEAKGVEPITPALKQIDALSSKDELAKELVHLQDYGIRALFGFYVRPDDKNASQEIAIVDQGGLGLPDRDYYLKTDPRSTQLRTEYEKHVAAMLTLLAKAEGKDGADAEAEAKTVLTIETALAKASLDRVARRNPDNTYHKMTVDQLALLTPDFEWKEFIATVGIPPIQSLNVAVPDFMKALNSTIGDTSLADLKTYLKWHVLTADADLLPAAFEQEHFHFYDHILNGTAEMPLRWKRCARATDRALGEALGQEFVKVAFSGPSREKALQLVGEIESEMHKDIETATWMTPDTKKQAFEKLRLVENKIGYPQKWRDYSSVNVVRDNYFADALAAREFEIHRNFNKIGKPVDKAEWGMTPPTVNAYYSPSMNNINFPAGILQPPFYNPKADDAVNYGAIGVVVGHELTHGFDDQGRRYDGEGNLRDWWTAEDGAAFEKRANCIADEYSGFSPTEGVKLNGKLTLGENATPQSSRARAMTDPHSPGQFRVNGTVQNMPEFRDAFSCKPGDPMVSAEPCRVW